MSNMEDDGQVAETIWVRGLYMLLFAVLYSAAEFVLWTVIVVQFGYKAINEESQPRLLELGASISRYIYQVMRYLSFNNEVKPYPFSDWPSDDADA